jgi:N-acetylneuraminic acid mutarotase
MSTSRYSFTGGVIDGKIYVFGGKSSDGENLKSTEMFDFRKDEWVMRADNNHNAGYGVEELTSAVVDGKLYVFGAYGWTGSNRISGTINFVEEYNPVADTWRSRAPKPTMVSLAPSTIYDSEIYIFGGNYYTEAGDQDVYYRSVEAFKPSTNTWRSVTSIPKNVQLFALATVGDKAYLMGGYLPDEDRMTGDVMTFDFVTGGWDVDSCRPMTDERRRAFSYSAAAPVIDGKIFLIGGMEGSFDMGVWASNKVDVYDPISNTWSVEQSLKFSVHSHLSLVMDGRIYVIGGTMRGLKTCFSAQY